MKKVYDESEENSADPLRKALKNWNKTNHS